MENEVTTPTGEELMADLGVTLAPPTPAPEPDVPEPEPDTESKPASNTEDLFQQAKENKAFADLRIQNKQYSNFIGRLAGALNIQSTDPNTIMESLQSALLAKEAETQKIPVEVLERMQRLEQQTQVYQDNELKQGALLGFNAVKEQFKLSDEAVTEFAKQLNEQGLNPFTQKMDLITQYKILNFDKLIADAEQRGIKQESSRADKVAQHSTHPGNTTGSSNAQNTNLSSVTALNDFLDKQK